MKSKKETIHHRPKKKSKMISLSRMTPRKVKRIFQKAIQKVLKRKEVYLAFKKAFSRNGKIKLETLIWAIMTLNNTTNDVFVDEFCEENFLEYFTPTAFYYARQKILPELFLAVLEQFYRDIKRYLPKIDKYNLLAMDGSEFRFPFNPKEPEAGIKTKGGKRNAHINLNALYDVRYGLFIGARLAKGSKKQEAESLIDLLRSGVLSDDDIVVTDRLYCIYKVLAAFKEYGGHFITRSKDVESKTGIFKNIKLPDTDTFDEEVILHLSYRQTRKLQFDPCYKYLPKKKFPFYKENEEIYELKLRVIRYKYKDEFYTLVTDISNRQLPTREVIKYYTKRWNIEVSFRDLKKICKLEYFHSKSSWLNKQEILARLAIYNVTKVILLCEPLKKKRKYVHKVAFSSVYRSMIKFLLGRIDEKRLLDRMRRKTQPIRENRAYPRKPGIKTPPSYNNR